MPLRFCMVTTFYPPYSFGGDGIYIYRLAEALTERGHRVDVIHSVDAYRLYHPAEPEISFAHHPGVTRYPLTSSRPWVSALAVHQLGRPAWYAQQLRDILDEQQYDVIHYHNISLIGGPGVLRVGRAVKLYTAHDYWLVCPTHALFTFNQRACIQRHCLACTLRYGTPPQSWRYTSWLKRCADEIDCFLMPSQFALEQHRAEGLTWPMAHLPCFVPSAAQESKHSPLPVPDRPFFLYAGRLEKLKGVQDLLRLFEDYKEADLLIAGTGSYAAVLQEQAQFLPHVHFLGQVHPASLGQLYRQAIAVLIPSLCYETFGLTAAEALAYGTPVIARRIGALHEIIDQSGGGYAFDSLAECLQAMERLRTQPDLRTVLGQRGLTAAKRYWSVKTHLDQYFDMITSLK